MTFVCFLFVSLFYFQYNMLFIVNYFIGAVIFVFIVHCSRNVQRRTHIQKIVSILLYVLLFVSSCISTFKLTKLLVHFDDIYYEIFTNISHPKLICFIRLHLLLTRSKMRNRNFQGDFKKIRVFCY